MIGYLADTHLALWLIDGSEKLPAIAKEMMCGGAGPWYLSTVSVWEVMLKHQVRPEQMLVDAETFLGDCEAAGFKILGLEPGHIFEASRLPLIKQHKDPFDRMLLAQARRESITLATHDKTFALYEDPHVLLV